MISYLNSNIYLGGKAKTSKQWALTAGPSCGSENMRTSPTNACQLQSQILRGMLCIKLIHNLLTEAY